MYQWGAAGRPLGGAVGGLGGGGGVGVGTALGLGGVAGGTMPPTYDVSGVPDDTISRLRWSPADCPMQLLAASSWDRTCRVWQVRTAPGAGASASASPVVTSAPMAMQQHSAPVLDVSLSHDGRAFYGGCCRTAMMWDLSSNQTRQVAAHDMPISCLEFARVPGAGTEMLITGSWDGKVRFWDLRQPTPAKEEDFGQPIFALDAKTAPMVTFATGRKLHVYNIQTMQRYAELPPNSMMKFAFRCIANYRTQSAVLAGSTEGRVAASPLDAANTRDTLCFKAHCSEHPTNKSSYTMYQTNFVAVHPSSATAVSGGGDGKVSIWNLTTKMRVTDLQPRMHGGEPITVSAGDLSADGSLLAYAASYDWAMGKEGHSAAQPRSITIVPMQAAWLR